MMDAMETKMKVYCVWAWDQYYPVGSDGNLKGIYYTMEAAKRRLDEITGYDYTDITTEFVGGAEDDAEEDMG